MTLSKSQKVFTIQSEIIWSSQVVVEGSLASGDWLGLQYQAWICSCEAGLQSRKWVVTPHNIQSTLEFKCGDRSMKKRRQWIHLSCKRVSERKEANALCCPSPEALGGLSKSLCLGKNNQNQRLCLNSGILLCGSSYCISQSKLRISQISLPYTDSGPG